MKTIFTLVTAFLMSITVFATNKHASRLSIKSVDNAGIRVVLDGKRFYPNDNSIMFGSMEPGTHHVKIFRKKRNDWFHINGGRYEMVYNGTIDLKRRTHLFISVERNGQISMMENRIRRDHDRDDDHDDVYDRHDRDYDRDNNGHRNNYNPHDGYTRPMSDWEFKNVLRSIEKEWFEGNKFKSASQVVKSNNFTTAQIQQLLLLFSFETNKLEIAKQAYMNTVDKRNYHKLFDVFSFSNSKRELEQYIDRCH